MPAANSSLRFIARIVLIGIAVLGAIQLVPYGRSHTNPPAEREPAWDRPATREYFFRLCKNCHSNETVWPWYSHVAPASWMVQQDVDEARRLFNVTEWGRPKNKGDEAAGELRDHEMPPFFYRLVQPETRLTATERDEFLQGLIRTFGDKTTPEKK